jgi:hypothetical protein
MVTEIEEGPVADIHVPVDFGGRQVIAFVREKRQRLARAPLVVANPAIGAVVVGLGGS